MKDKLKKARIDAGMTQTVLAKLLGVSHSAISAWERGEKMPEAEHIYLYQTVLGLKNDYFCELADIGDDPDKELDISILNAKGLRLLYSYYEELLHNDEFLKESVPSKRTE